jgi:gamma-glutamylcyclotransferase (GGCT)/AIG2-like uncharacterized protein YtfP
MIRTIQNCHVFVYGTLKPGESNFDRYCGDRVITSDRAYILGELYHFPSLGYPGTIHGNSRVHGFVLTFADPTILTNLDKLEDYDPAKSAIENDYTRELVMTYTPEGIPWITAWAYFMTLDRSGGILVPDGWWGIGDRL